LTDVDEILETLMRQDPLTLLDIPIHKVFELLRLLESLKPPPPIRRINLA